MSDDPQARVTVTPGSKQITLDGEHFADAVTPEAARTIAEAMQERERVVAWLRERDHVCADVLADQIEKGRHIGR